jgi:NAD(P)H-hydrate epimerase
MKPVLSCAEMREFDRRASEECFTPSLLLMENAGRGAADVLLARYPSARAFLVVTGAGNNGGDGFVVARRLRTLGRDVIVLAAVAPERLSGDAATNHRAFVGVGGRMLEGEAALARLRAPELASSDVIVDALFGTGLTRAPAGDALSFIEAMNASRARRVALDLPSGLSGDTGFIPGAAVRAELTVTFAHRKRGSCTPIGASLSGELVVVDIGVPPELAETSGYGAALLEASDVSAWVSARDTLSHKGRSGRVLVLAGSPGKIGAALLTARGALRAGAGLVTLAGFPEAADKLEQRVTEAMTARLDENALESSLDPLLEAADVVAVGPGLGLDERAGRIVERALLHGPGTIVADADALTHFAGRVEKLKQAPGQLVLTPHAGELARLLGISVAEVETDRFAAVSALAEQSGQVALLKGAYTLIASPGKRVVANPTGHPLLATGGAGDVLSGVIAALCVMAGARRGACAGAYVHGLAAERLARERGVDRGVLASEVADAVPGALAALSAGRAALPV